MPKNGISACSNAGLSFESIIGILIKFDVRLCVHFGLPARSSALANEEDGIQQP